MCLSATWWHSQSTFWLQVYLHCINLNQLSSYLLATWCKKQDTMNPNKFMFSMLETNTTKYVRIDAYCRKTTFIKIHQCSFASHMLILVFIASMFVIISMQDFRRKTQKSTMHEWWWSQQEESNDPELLPTSKLNR